MLMTVLKGPLATRQSKAIIRTFKRMKDYIIENQGLLGERELVQLSLQTAENVREISSLRSSLETIDNKVAGIVDTLGEVVTKSELAEIMLDFGGTYSIKVSISQFYGIEINKVPYCVNQK